MAHAEHTVVVARPPDEVFEFLTDLSNVPSWQSGSVEVQAPPQSSLDVGTTYVQVLRFLGKRMKSTVEVTEFEPGRRFSLKTLSGPIPFEVRHTLEPAGGGGTELRVELEGEPGGFFKLAESLVERNAQRQIEQDFTTLKEMVEARAAAGSGSSSSETDTS